MNVTESITVCDESEAAEQGLMEHWDSLAAVLAREIAVYGELSELCLKEKDVLVNFSTEDLIENNSRKETILLKARIIEESRIKLVARISELLGMESGGIGLSTLIDHAEGEQEEVLRESQRTLRGILEELGEVNENNKILLDSSILYVQKSIDFISRLMAPSLNYGTDGELKASPPSGRILRRKG